MKIQSSMESLTINNIGKDIWQWKVSTQEHNILYFLWNRFIKSSDDSIIDFKMNQK